MKLTLQILGPQRSKAAVCRLTPKDSEQEALAPDSDMGDSCEPYAEKREAFPSSTVGLPLKDVVVALTCKDVVGS